MTGVWRLGARVPSADFFFFFFFFFFGHLWLMCNIVVDKDVLKHL